MCRQCRAMLRACRRLLSLFILSSQVQGTRHTALVLVLHFPDLTLEDSDSHEMNVIALHDTRGPQLVRSKNGKPLGNDADNPRLLSCYASAPMQSKNMNRIPSLKKTKPRNRTAGNEMPPSGHHVASAQLATASSPKPNISSRERLVELG